MPRTRKEKKKWRFFWKNFCGFGAVIRLAAAGALFFVSYRMKDEDELMAMLLGGWGGAFLFDAVTRWSPYRALLKWPTRCAYKRHYPEDA
jgi:hypothetical protein